MLRAVRSLTANVCTLYYTVVFIFIDCQNEVHLSWRQGLLNLKLATVNYSQTLTTVKHWQTVRPSKLSLNYAEKSC